MSIIDFFIYKFKQSHIIVWDFEFLLMRKIVFQQYKNHFIKNQAKLMQVSMKSDLAEYFMIKSTVQLPIKVKYYFDSLESVIEYTSPPQSLPQGNRPFISGFIKLSLTEKARYLNESIKFVAKALLKTMDQQMPKQNNDIKLIETSAQLSTTTLKIPRWINVAFKLDKTKHLVTLTTNKKTTSIYLQNYLIRKSKKYKGTIVFVGAAENVKSDKKKIQVYFKSTVCNQIYEQLFLSMMAYRNEEILSIIQDSLGKQSNNDRNGYTVFLSPKNINEYLTFKDQVIKNLLAGRLDFKSVKEHKEDESQIVIKQCNNIQKIFKSESSFDQQAKEVKKRIQSVIKKNKFCIYSQELQRFSHRYQAIYEKYLIEGKLLDLISIHEENNNPDQEEVLFIKGIKNIMTQNFIEFMWIKVREISHGKSKLLMICSVNLSQSIRPEVVRNFLFQIHQFAHQKQGMKLMMEEGNHQSQEEQFHTIYGNSLVEEEFLQFVEGENDMKNLQEIPKYTQQISQKFQQTYLSNKFSMVPTDGVDLTKCLMKSHYLFPEWERQKNGLVCNNQAIINEQKKIFKHVITTFGNNILKGGGILNVSFPINIFKKQSHLTSVAKDFCYAPLLFDGVKDPMQRIKAATLLAISVGTLGISLDKPFNPILGETLQVWIGGCPMYLQQISHHPPMNSYLFIGRGYRIHGKISPKVNFGLNNVKGYSELPNYIIFDDGTEIQVVYGKMIINGIMFGERSFNFDDEIYAYDKTNSMYSLINYGPRKKGMMSKSTDPKDFCHGKIYSIKPQFVKKFQSISPRPYPDKSMFVSQLSQFEGIWNQSIKFDGKEKFNFTTQLPCQLQQEKFPLPSNSSYRKDLENLIAGNKEEAQKQKDILEQIQRRDRKLREEHSKTVKK